jgi:hypothetical protein
MPVKIQLIFSLTNAQRNRYLADYFKREAHDSNY